MAWDVMSRVTKMAWDVMSGVTKTAWDVLSGVANLCGMFCPGCKKMAWDVLSRDVLSGSLGKHMVFYDRVYIFIQLMCNRNDHLAKQSIFVRCLMSSFASTTPFPPPPP